MKLVQKKIVVSPKPRGFHLISSELERALPELEQLGAGLAHIFIQHTSASLTLNENADPAVRSDMETFFSVLAPDGSLPFRHTDEGPDDMTAHAKSTLIGASLTIPFRDGAFLLGTWQGIYLCEHRQRAGSRSLIVTLMGEG